MERVHQELRTPTRFTFDSAAEHVYTLLLKKDCYPRFIRSEHYKNLLAAGVQPSQKKRFVFVFQFQLKQLKNLKMFFWVFPQRQFVVGRRFGTLYRFHLQRLTHFFYTSPSTPTYLP